MPTLTLDTKEIYIQSKVKNPKAQLNILLYGDGGVGKTTFVNHLMTGHFSPKYVATRGCVQREFSFFTNHGWIKFQFYDTAGQEMFQPQYPIYSKIPNSAILMVSKDSKLSHQSIKGNLGLLPENCTNICIVVNKLDVPVNRSCPCPHGVAAFNVSSRTGLNILEPLLHLSKTHLQDPNLVLINAETVRQNRAYLLTQIKWIREHPQDWSELENQDTVQLMVNMSRLLDHQIRMILLY